MTVQLRQVCVVTRDLEHTLSQLRRVLGLQAGFVDPEVERFGARNTICPLGSNFLELITPQNGKAPSKRFLDANGGDTGYMVITQVDSRTTQQAIRARAIELGVRAVFDIRARGADYLQWHPADTGGSFLETTFDFRAELEGFWDPAGGYACSQVQNAYPIQLVRVGVTAKEPVETARRWAELTLSRMTCDATGSPQIELNNAAVYFCPPDTHHSLAGLKRVHLVTPEQERIIANARAAGLLTDYGAVRIAGLDFILQPGAC